MADHNHFYTGYVGTYTKGESKGIYRFTLDTEQQTISGVTLSASLENPTYVSISRDNRHLYAVVKEGAAGGVSSFAIDQPSGDLIPINKQLSKGSSPCHVSVDSKNKTIVTANYHKGTVEAYSVEEGEISPANSVIQLSGSGPNSERQEKPHTHFSGFSPDGKYIVAIDLGIDQLLTYKLIDGVLEEVHSLSLKPGSGPRHLVFGKTGNHAYLMTELSNEVVTLNYDSDTGRFTEINYHKAIPEDFKDNSQGSAIHLAPDGRFVYAANRGHDSIALFAVHPESGDLTFVEHTSTMGNWPRDFIIDPTGKFLIAANQETHNLVLYARDEMTGKLEMLQSDISVPYGVCVKFLHY